MAAVLASKRLPMIVIVSLSAMYLLGHIDRGWIPSDDGMLGQAARRLVAGELPHRDFTDPYTGGLTWLHAWAFRLLGDRLGSLRLVLFAACLVWVTAVQYIATRFVRPWPATLVTALCVVWSVPNYPASMPSWYNLFFATFGAAALLRFVEDRRIRWILGAGAAAGVSMLFKIIGLYFLAAGLLSLIVLARDDEPAATTGTRPGSNAYFLFVTACLVLFVLALVGVVRQALHPRELFTFVLPGALLAAALVRSEWRDGTRDHAFTRLFRMVIPFVAGAAIPIVIFLIPFWRGGALHALLRGVFVLPQRRLLWAYEPPLPLWTIAAAIPVVALAWLLSRRERPLARWTLLAASVALIAVLWVVGFEATSYRIVWSMVRAAPAIVVGVAAWNLARASSGTASRIDRARVAILASTLACCSLVQFPYSAPVYFFYAAPLLFLAALPWIARTTRAARQGAAVFAAFLIAFAVLRINGTPLQFMGRSYQAAEPMQPLPNDHGGILVPDEHARIAADVIGFLREKARGGFTWASPDAPEIYYLSGLRNPTPTFYEFLDDAPDRDASVLRAIDEHGITAVVLNRTPFFSPPISEEMYRSLARRFPYGRSFGSLVVLWRD